MRSDTRLAMREFRFLDEKRKLTRLKEPEERRWLELKQVLSAAAPQQPPDNYPAGVNGYPAPPAELVPHAAAAVQPSEAQSQWASSVAPRAPADPPRSFPSFDIDLRLADEGPPLSAAELLGLVEPTQTEPAPPPAVAAPPPPTSTAAEAPGDDVIELDPGDVTMLEADSNAAPDDPETRSEAPTETDLPPIALLPSDAVDREPDVPFASHPPSAPSPPEVALPKLPPSTDPFGLPVSVANASPAPPEVASEVDSQPENLWPPSSLEMPLEIRTDQATVVRVSPDREADEPVRAVPPEVDAALSAATWQSQVPGEHRVIIHLLDGQVKRGIVRDLDLTGSSVHLEEPEIAEDIPFDQLKAVFFMGSSTGGHLPEAQKIRVTLTDGRQLTGYSTDYKQSGTGFFLEPSDTRTHTFRIFLLHAGVEKIGEE